MVSNFLSRCFRAPGLKLHRYSLGVNYCRQTHAQATDLNLNAGQQTAAVESVPIIDPLKHPDYFQVHKLFTVKDLFDAKVHLGHKVGTLDDRMKQFVFGNRLDQMIIDLDQTAECLRQALNFIAHIAYRKGVILFVSRHQQTVTIVEQVARECGEYAHTRQWDIGTFTDVEQFYGEETRLPDLLIFLNTLSSAFEEHVAVKDSAKMLIPTVGIVDTNCNPNLITYPIPGNDDTPEAVTFYCKLFKETILLGKRKRAELEKK